MSTPVSPSLRPSRCSTDIRPYILFYLFNIYILGYILSAVWFVYISWVSVQKWLVHQADTSNLNYPGFMLFLSAVLAFISVVYPVWCLNEMEHMSLFKRDGSQHL